MNTILLYLGQLILVSGLLYGYYHLFLRNKQFHRYNRYYLLAVLILSITVPFLNIPIYFSGESNEAPALLQSLNIISADVHEDTTTTATEIATSRPFPWAMITFSFYVLIFLIAMGRIFYSLYYVRRVIRRHTIERLHNLHFINTDEPGTPFSFFNWLFWNKSIDLNSKKGEQIFRHELYHIRQRHSIDVVLAEALTAIVWINPFFHLLKKELRTIHEFLADQHAVSEKDKWAYAELLLMQVLNTRKRLVHPFFNNQIKRRIAMITHSSKTRFRYLRKLMVIPIVAIVILLFAFNYKYIRSKSAKTDRTVTVVIDAGHGGAETGAITPAGVSEKDIVLAIAQKVRSLNKDKQVRIILSRESDINTPLKVRTDLAKTEKADLFLSLHVNTTQGATGTSGIELVMPSKNLTFYGENKIVSSILLSHFSQVYNTKLEIKKSESNIWVLENAVCPAVLMELGYMSNQTDLAFITNSSNQEKIARSILNSIDQFFSQQAKIQSSHPTVGPTAVSDHTGTDLVFTKTEIEPKYAGDAQRWYEFLSKSIDWDQPKQKGAPNGDYTVVVEFIVDTEGNISKLRPLTKHGYGMEEQVLNMLGNCPNWVPAIQNGRPVKSYSKQQVIFNIGVREGKPSGVPLNSPLRMKKWIPGTAEDGC